jgi:uncharacterized protein GlcG (DUF336 family)
MIKRIAGATAILLGLLTPAAAQDEPLVTFQVLAPRLAIELAQAAMQDCDQKGFQVAVAVVDRFGVMQTLLRNRFAGPHTPDTATRKAWTAVSFRSDTVELVGATAGGTPQAGARDITGALMLGGGVVINVAGSMVGAVGVSGAPSGEEDDACARAGIAAIQDQLPL